MTKTTKRQKTYKNKKGFFEFYKAYTLIELLIVISIIALIATMVLAVLGNARKKARDAARLSDMKQVITALEMYYDDHGNRYPNQSTGDCTINYQSLKGSGDNKIGDYINLPDDRLNSGLYAYKYYSSNNQEFFVYSRYEMKAGWFQCSEKGCRDTALEPAVCGGG